MDTREIPPKPLPQQESSSECDTDEEVQRLKKKTSQSDDDYGGSTEVESEEESGLTTKRNLMDLPNFFLKHHFLFYGTFDPNERKLLFRYITAYNG